MRIISTCGAFVFAISGCGGGSTEPGTEGVAAVVISPAELDTLFALGETVQLSALPRDAADAGVPGAAVTYQSSATNVATVSGTGLITSAGNGAATVTATASTVSASVVVRVRQKLASLVGLPATASVAVARTRALSVTPADARGGAISGLTPGFASGNEDVARVSANGVVTGVAIGSATITTSVVSPSDGTKTGTTVVTVAAAPPAIATVTMSATRFIPDTGMEATVVVS